MALAHADTQSTAVDDGYQILYNFGQGGDVHAGYYLVPDGNGGYFGGSAPLVPYNPEGGSYGHGGIYHLTETSGVWSESVLYENHGGVAKSHDLVPTLFDVATQRLFAGDYWVDTYASGTKNVYVLKPASSDKSNWTPVQISDLSDVDGGPYYQLFSSSEVGVDGQGVYGVSRGLTGAESCGEYGCGTLFRLDPAQSGGRWVGQVLYRFPQTLGFPVLTPDGTGGFFGTAVDFSAPIQVNASWTAYQTVFFRIAPSAGDGTWALTELYRFDPSTEGYRIDLGIREWAVKLAGQPLVSDGAGGYYGINPYGPPNPTTGLSDKPTVSGVLYHVQPGADNSAWSNEVLFRFPIVKSSGGVVYGELLNPYWLTRDPQTNVLYGLAKSGTCGYGYSDCGAIFSATPPASVSGSWSVRTEHIFDPTTQPYDGVQPSYLFGGQDGRFYGTTGFGGEDGESGNFFALKPQ